MTNPVRLLRISYWWGIIMDAVMAVLMLFPTLMLRLMNIHLDSDTSFGYGIINAAPLMIGWTILLFWADRKPLERKAILPLTLPVVAGYAIVQTYFVTSGLTTLGQMLPLFVSQASMSLFFVFSYLSAKTPAHERLTTSP